MYKYLISFICFMFIVAMCISKHNGSDEFDDVQYSESEEIINYQTPSALEEPIEEVTYQAEEESFTQSIEIPFSTSGNEGQVLVRRGYTLSYDIRTKNPIWVAWQLSKDHVNGTVPRYKGPYLDDTEVKGYTPNDMDWERRPRYLSHGHMCPAGDNKWDEEAMRQTFYLSNMCPQASGLNSGGWNRLEEKCRDWARQYDSVYIACGPVFYSETPETMGRAEIWIPDAFYKVILRLGSNPEALGFLYANNEEPHHMQECVRTVDEIEALTGLDFFKNLDDDIELTVESSSDLSIW